MLPMQHITLSEEFSFHMKFRQMQLLQISIQSSFQHASTLYYSKEKGITVLC